MGGKRHEDHGASPFEEGSRLRGAFEPGRSHPCHVGEKAVGLGGEGGLAGGRKGLRGGECNEREAFLEGEDGRNLLAAYRRAGNIVAIEEKKDGRTYDGHPVAGALVEPAEATLHAALEEARGRIDAALAAEDFAGAMAALAALRRPVDAFFDHVLVNAPEPDLRRNRLLMLAQIRAGLHRVADFSLIEDAPVAR